MSVGAVVANPTLQDCLLLAVHLSLGAELAYPRRCLAVKLSLGALLFIRICMGFGADKLEKVQRCTHLNGFLEKKKHSKVIEDQLVFLPFARQ